MAARPRRHGDMCLLARHDSCHARPVTSGVGTRTLLVGKNVDDVEESGNVLQTSLAVAIPIVLGALAIVVWWLTGHVLRPVEAIRSEVASITGDELHRRVPVHSRDDEISRLARTMNAMLTRVQQVTDRQRQFVADASHELRSRSPESGPHVRSAFCTPRRQTPMTATANCSPTPPSFSNSSTTCCSWPGPNPASTPSLPLSSISTILSSRRCRGSGPAGRSRPTSTPSQPVGSLETRTNSRRPSPTSPATRSDTPPRPSRSISTRVPATRCSPLRTTALASPPTRDKPSSSGSPGSTLRVHGKPAALGWVWPSSTTS